MAQLPARVAALSEPALRRTSGLATIPEGPVGFTPTDLLKAIIPAIIGGIVTAYVVPKLQTGRQKRDQAKNFAAHIAATVKHFKENSAVLRAIADANHQAAFPVADHIENLIVADFLLTEKVVTLAHLSDQDRSAALYIAILIGNCNRNVKALARLLAGC